jgi:very-short-patch-repair endonuclease
MAEVERRLWQELRLRQISSARFRRQHSFGIYIADFVCLEKKLVIEVDGGQHNESKTDLSRDQWFRERGYQVLRFWNNDIFQNIDGVKQRIDEALSVNDTPHLNPPPQGGRK